MAKKNNFDTIIWDWNGTLLDDMEICIECINRLLKRRSRPLIRPETYRQIFTFPIRDYYQAAGFDFSKEAFEIPAEEFIAEYKQSLSKAGLFIDAKETLALMKASGKRQFILSAMEQQALASSLKDNDIYDYFEGIFGIADNYAVSKVSRGLDLIERYAINRERTIMVGDTLHDAEVAKALNINIFIIGRGHQNPIRFVNTDCIIVNTLEEFREAISL